MGTISEPEKGALGWAPRRKTKRTRKKSKEAAKETRKKLNDKKVPETFTGEPGKKLKNKAYEKELAKLHVRTG